MNSEEDINTDAFNNAKFSKLKLEGKLDGMPNEKMLEFGEKLDNEINEEAEKGLAIRMNKQFNDLKELKDNLKTKIGAPFMTNVLRVALNYKETRLAGLIVAKYRCVIIDEKMLIRAIKTNQMYFLYCVWAYNKNYTRVYKEDQNVDLISEESDDESTNSQGEF